jgi:hypothetical protein
VPRFEWNKPEEHPRRALKGVSTESTESTGYAEGVLTPNTTAWSFLVLVFIPTFVLSVLSVEIRSGSFSCKKASTKT